MKRFLISLLTLSTITVHADDKVILKVELEPYALKSDLTNKVTKSELSTEVSTLNTKINNSISYTTAVSNKLEGSISSLNTKVNNSISYTTSVSNKLEGEISSLGTKINTVSNNLQTVINNNYNTLDKKIDDSVWTANTNILNYVNVVSNKMDTGITTSINYTTAVSNKLSGEVSSLNTKVNTLSNSLDDVAFSGDYNDLSNKPTKLSEFINDTKYVTDSVTNGLASINYVNNHRWDYTTQVTNAPDFALKSDLSNYALDTNVVHGRLGTGSYGGYLVNNTTRFYDSNTSYVELGIDPYIEVHRGNSISILTASVAGDTDYPILGVTGYDYYAPSNTGFLAITQNPDGSPDNVPSNIALTETTGLDTYITNAVGFKRNNNLFELSGGSFISYDNDDQYFYATRNELGLSGRNNSQIFIYSDTPKVTWDESNNHHFNYLFPTNKSDGSYILATTDDVPSNIALTKTEGYINYITNAVAFNYSYVRNIGGTISTNYYEAFIPMVPNKYAYDNNSYSILVDAGKQEISEEDLSLNNIESAQLVLYADRTWSRTNAVDGDLPGYTIRTEGESPYPDVTYGLLGTYFAGYDEEGNDYPYNYLFPTNHTTKYLALTDDPNGVPDIDLSDYTTKSYVDEHQWSWDSVTNHPDMSGYVPFVVDNAGNKTAIDLEKNPNITPGKYSISTGSSTTYATGDYSSAFGWSSAATGNYSLAAGNSAFAHGTGSIALGHRVVTSVGSSTGSMVNGVFIWQGIAPNLPPSQGAGYYYSHGEGTFNIRPTPKAPSTDPATGFYIGDSNLVQIVNNMIEARISQMTLFTAQDFTNELKAAITKGIKIEGTNYVLVVQPDNSGPYTPSSFPAYVKFTNSNSGSWFIYQIDNKISSGQEIEQQIIDSEGSDSELGSSLSNGIDNENPYLRYNKGIFLFKVKPDFTLVSITSGYTYEWIDSSTLQ